MLPQNQRRSHRAVADAFEFSVAGRYPQPLQRREGVASIADRRGPWVTADLGAWLWAGSTSPNMGNKSVSYK